MAIKLYDKILPDFEKKSRISILIALLSLIIPEIASNITAVPI